MGGRVRGGWGERGGGRKRVERGGGYKARWGVGGRGKSKERWDACVGRGGGGEGGGRDGGGAGRKTGVWDKKRKK